MPVLSNVDVDNVGAACRLTLRPGQERFVAPVAQSLAEAYVQPDTAWPRLVLDDDGEVAAFVMGAFDASAPLWFFQCGIWRLNVAADAQGRGFGRFAVEAVLEEARRREFRRASVLWVPGPEGPAEFYARLGFDPTGEEFHGQIVGARDL